MGNPNHLPAGGSTGGQFTSQSFRTASANLDAASKEAETATDFEAVRKAKLKVEEAQKEVDATPEGVRNLRSELSKAKDKFTTRNLTRRLDEGRVKLAVQKGVPQEDTVEFHKAVMNNIKGHPVAIPENHANYSELKKMEEDGWIPYPGSYGIKDTDRSVKMVRAQPEMGGYFTVEFRDRDINGQHEVTQSGHFVVPGRGEYTANQERAFTPKPGKNTLNAYKKEIGKCDVDGEYVGFKNLKYVPYAGAVKPEHYDEAMAKYRKSTGNL